jgi:hypothetical protein
MRVRLALPPDKFAVRGRSAALAERHDLAIHRDTRGAARSPLFEPGIDEDAVEPFRFGHALDEPRPGHDHAGHDSLAPFQYACGNAQIAEPAVGAGTDEDAIDADSEKGTASARIGQGPLGHLESAMQAGVSTGEPICSASSGLVPHVTIGRASASTPA